MADNDQVIATPDIDPQGAVVPSGTIDNPPETPPQTPAPVVEPDKPQGITDDPGREQREAFYQTKYQGTLNELKRIREANELAARTQRPIQAAQPPAPQPGTPPVEYDLSTTEGYQAYQQAMLEKTAQAASQAVAKTYEQIRVEERANAEAAESFKVFSSWAAENKVPSEMQKQAADYVLPRLGLNCSPADAIVFVMQYIREQAVLANEQNRLAAIAKDAAEKSKLLAQVQTPSPGAPPGPMPAKTDAQKKAEELTGATTQYRRPQTYAT
jgi:hypothetical protein